MLFTASDCGLLCLNNTLQIRPLLRICTLGFADGLLFRQPFRYLRPDIRPRYVSTTFAHRFPSEKLNASVCFLFPKKPIGLFGGPLFKQLVTGQYALTSPRTSYY